MYSFFHVEEGDTEALYHAYQAFELPWFTEFLLGRSSPWDYRDPSFVGTRLVEAIDALSWGDLSSRDQFWLGQIKWLYHNHACQQALIKYRDVEEAREHARLTLEYEPSGYPQHGQWQVTFLLLNGRVEEAQKICDGLKEAEKDVAKALIQEYLSGEILMTSNRWPLVREVRNHQGES